MWRKAATFSGAKIIERPTITTTRGQTTCQAVISRFMRDIQKFPRPSVKRPAATR